MEMIIMLLSLFVVSLILGLAKVLRINAKAKKQIGLLEGIQNDSLKTSLIHKTPLHMLRSHERALKEGFIKKINKLDAGMLAGWIHTLLDTKNKERESFIRNLLTSSFSDVDTERLVVITVQALRTASVSNTSNYSNVFLLIVAAARESGTGSSRFMEFTESLKQKTEKFLEDLTPDDQVLFEAAVIKFNRLLYS